MYEDVWGIDYVKFMIIHDRDTSYLTLSNIA